MSIVIGVSIKQGVCYCMLSYTIVHYTCIYVVLAIDVESIGVARDK